MPKLKAQYQVEYSTKDLDFYLYDAYRLQFDPTIKDTVVLKNEEEIGVINDTILQEIQNNMLAAIEEDSFYIVLNRHAEQLGAPVQYILKPNAKNDGFVFQVWIKML
ncbi:TPA: hypothetical protein ACGO1T_001917 [Streptococcus suis]